MWILFSSMSYSCPRQTHSSGKSKGCLKLLPVLCVSFLLSPPLYNLQPSEPSMGVWPTSTKHAAKIPRPDKPSQENTQTAHNLLHSTSFTARQLVHVWWTDFGCFDVINSSPMRWQRFTGMAQSSWYWLWPGKVLYVTQRPCTIVLHASHDQWKRSWDIWYHTSTHAQSTSMTPLLRRWPVHLPKPTSTCTFGAQDYFGNDIIGIRYVNSFLVWANIYKALVGISMILHWTADYMYIHASFVEIGLMKARMCSVCACS